VGNCGELVVVSRYMRKDIYPVRAVLGGVNDVSGARCGTMLMPTVDDRWIGVAVHRDQN